MPPIYTGQTGTHGRHMLQIEPRIWLGGSRGVRMQFYVLGPLEVRPSSETVLIRSSRLRALLAILLLHPSQIVPMARIIDGIWLDKPPRSAVENIRTYIWQLRSLLNRADDRERVESHPSGYRLLTEVEELDLLRFRMFATDGTRALRRGDYSGAAALLGQAEALWRGDVLPDLQLGQAVRGRIVALEEQRWHVQSDWISARTTLGEHAEVAATLRVLLAERPLDETLWGHLIWALYLMGRTAEALSAYAEVRHTLVRELGIEPGPELRKIHHAVLRGKTRLADPAQARTMPEPQRVQIPRQLPASSSDFTGRQPELRAISQLVETGAVERGAVVTISGLPGVGKSTTAVAAATAVRSAFPDGQLYVNLNGSTDRPLPAAEALSNILSGFGLHQEALSDGEEHRASLYRSLLAERRMLVILDDAAETSQVRPLLPGLGQSLFLITSRRRLSDLDTTVRIGLEPLSCAEALEMLEGIIGRERVRNEAAASQTIVEACGRLPLPIRIMGARLAACPGRPLQPFQERLADRHLLDELSLGTLSMRQRFQASYETLHPTTQRCFCLLGLLDRDGITPEALAALLHCRMADADRQLEQLVHDGLLSAAVIERDEPRYSMPSMLHMYARERLNAARSGLSSPTGFGARRVAAPHLSLHDDLSDIPRESVVRADQRRCGRGASF